MEILPERLESILEDFAVYKQGATSGWLLKCVFRFFINFFKQFTCFCCPSRLDRDRNFETRYADVVAEHLAFWTEQRTTIELRMKNAANGAELARDKGVHVRAGVRHDALLDLNAGELCCVAFNESTINSMSTTFVCSDKVCWR